MTADDKKISSLYQQGKDQDPPAHLDNAILSAARDEVQDRQQAKKSATARSPLFASPFSGGWRASASIAAVLVITIILVPLLQQEEMSPTVSRVADEMPILEKEQDLIRASDVKAPDVRKPSAAKENREVNITAKKRSQTTVPEQRQVHQLYQAPAKTVNVNTFSRGKQLTVEEKTAPVRTVPEMSERSLFSAQKPQPASAAVGTAALHDQEPHDQESHDQERASAEIKPQGRRMPDADKRPSVTMAVKPWLQKIRQLIAQGDLDLAQEELDEFKLRYPDEDIDPSIVSQLKGASVD